MMKRLRPTIKSLLPLSAMVFLLAPRPALAVECPVESYQFYVDNFGETGCTIGDKTFVGFVYSTSGTFGLSAEDITVNPESVDGDLGFLFNSAWSVPPGESLDTLLGYTVIATSATIHDIFLACNCFSEGDAIAQVTESWETGTGEVGQLSVSSLSNLTDTAFFTPTTSVTVRKDILLNRAPDDSFATISLVVNRFSQIPEPALMSLFGLGLVGAAALHRRRRRRNR